MRATLELNSMSLTRQVFENNNHEAMAPEGTGDATPHREAAACLSSPSCPASAGGVGVGQERREARQLGAAN
jgi:hypothetical protein